MLQKDAVEFLQRHLPFSRLDTPTLTALASALRLELYPAGAPILQQGEAPAGDLHIVREGLVRISARTGPDREPVLDFRGPGETFGYRADETAGHLDASVVAVGDAACYVAGRAQVRRLLADHPGLEEYLAPAYFPRREDRGTPPAPPEQALRDGSERILYSLPVQDLASREVVTASADLPVLEAARLMSARRIGSLVIVDERGRPTGIVTNTDLRDRVLVRQLDPSAPVGGVMSGPPVTVEGRDLCADALLKMMSHDVHHLPVMEAGRLAGIVTNHDFMVVQGTSPLLLMREIEGQATVEGLAAAARKVSGLLALLLREGVGASGVMQVVTRVNDRIEQRIVDLAVLALGPPPVPFCWIVYGSAGRREQTFKTDQDNAVVYRDPAGAEEERAAREYFGRLASFVVDAFLRCGFARCAGNYMASNERWRQPLRVWKRYFEEWLSAPVEAALHDAANLFDFRPLHGALPLGAELKGHLASVLPGQPRFLKALADLTTDYRPPLGFFGGLVVAKGGEHAHTLDLKKDCLTPLVNLARLFSFECGVAETSTLDRIAALKGVHPSVRAVGDDLAHAFEFFSLLRMRHQAEQIAAGRDSDNFVNPKRLSAIEQKRVKEYCRLLAELLDGVSRRYAVP
jgi:CBS domain-containing protein